MNKDIEIPGIKLDDGGMIAREIHPAITGRHENKGAVKRIASLIRLSEASVYAYMNQRTGMTLEFLHAAVIGTNGDPDVRKWLEPAGWGLLQEVFIEKGTIPDWEKEFGDVSIATAGFLSKFREKFEDGIIDSLDVVELLRMADKVRKEVDEIVVLAKMSAKETERKYQAKVTGLER